VVAARVVDRLRYEVIVPAVIFAGFTIYAWRAHSSLVRPIDLIGAVLAILFCLLPRKPIAAAALTIVELFVLNASFNALVDGKYFRPRLPIIDALRRAAPKEPFRVDGYDWTLLPNASAQYGLEDVRGADPMSFDAYTEFLKKIAIDDPAIDVDRVTNVDDPLLDELNVRFLIAEPGAAFGGRWKPIYAGRDGTLFENRQARPRFWSENASIHVDEASSTRFRLRVESAEPATILSSQPVFGWRMSIDGRAVVADRKSNVFLAFTAPAGASTVEVVYAPASFYATLPLAALTAILLCFQNCGIALLRRALARVPTSSIRVFENRR